MAPSDPVPAPLTRLVSLRDERYESIIRILQGDGLDFAGAGMDSSILVLPTFTYTCMQTPSFLRVPVVASLSQATPVPTARAAMSILALCVTAAAR